MLSDKNIFDTTINNHQIAEHCYFNVLLSPNKIKLLKISNHYYHFALMFKPLFSHYRILLV